MSEENKNRIIDKQSAIIITSTLAIVSFLVAKGTTDHDSLQLVILNSMAIFTLIALAIIIWATPALILRLLKILPESPPDWALILLGIIGGILALKSSDYFQLIYQHIKEINLEIIYG